MDYLFGLQIYQEERLGLWFHVQTAYPVQTSTSTPEGILHEVWENQKTYLYEKLELIHLRITKYSFFGFDDN